MKAHIDGVRLETLRQQSRYCGGSRVARDESVPRGLACYDRTVPERRRGVWGLEGFSDHELQLRRETEEAAAVVELEICVAVVMSC